MSAGELRITLRLQSGDLAGEVFENVAIKDRTCSLAEFLDAALKDLEVRTACAVKDESGGKSNVLFTNV